MDHGGEHIKVTTDNEHLGQIVSGTNQSEKNVDLRILKSRGSLYKLLGPAFSYKCMLSPVVKLHLYRTYICPIIRSGLSSLTLRQTTLPKKNSEVHPESQQISQLYTF